MKDGVKGFWVIKVVGDVVLDELKTRMADQVRNVLGVAGQEVVDTDHRRAEFDKPFAQMAPEKSGAARDQNAFVFKDL
jgi:hypothetical protein